jgi:hypothetical protein
MGARFYDPALGRWLSADTLVPEPGNPQAFNRFSYVGGNPLRYIDPTGHLTDDQIQEYTDYNTDEELENLKEEYPDLYQMLGWLHLCDVIPFGLDYYEATLIEGRLYFVSETGSSETLELDDFFGAETYTILRDSPEGRVHAYFWAKGQEPIINWRVCGVLDYHRVSKSEEFFKFQVNNAIGAGLIGAGVGLLTAPLTGPAGPVVGFVVGVAVDLAVEAAPTPPGKEAGDEILRYMFATSGWVEVTIIRDGQVISHEWEEEQY